MLAFMTSMLGLVIAGDVLTLFIFWEGTSILSYLLVAYKYKDEAARQGAFRALFITGGGGIALLAGLLFVGHVAGSMDFQTILSSGDVLRGSALYPVMLGLVAFGAFTKSAQFPAHIWLPGAMSAPTPASAYLHSATMVKAGIYLLARMNPALGFTESWFWLLTSVGVVTMVAGAYLGLKQNDLKALLAYSTVSQLGVLVVLIGQDIEEAFKALVIGVVAHALYKSALFLVAGIVDHEAGTRDIRRLGGLRRVMPFTFAVGLVAALSMAGLPPLFGFLAKETLLAAAIHPTLPPLVASLLPWAAVVAGALMLAQAGVMIYETFLGRAKDSSVHAHEAPRLMWLMPAIPAFLSVLFSVLPGPKDEATFLAGAAAAAYGDKVKVSLALWHGINVPLLLSIAAITLGSIIFYFRKPVRDFQTRLWPRLSFNALYQGVLTAIYKSARLATRLQGGRLRLYLEAMVAATVVLVLIFTGGRLLPDLSLARLPTTDFSGATQILRLFALLVTVGAALASIVLRRDFGAVLALSASGLGMALLFALEPAPDVALVQIVVDILATVILVLALARLPRGQRAAAQRLALSELRSRRPLSLIRDLIVAGSIGLIVASLTYVALTSRPMRDSQVTPYYEANAKTQAEASDIVGAIVVDFRQLDTVIEITVFSAAGLGAYMLLRPAAAKAGDRGSGALGNRGSQSRAGTRGIAGHETSAFIRLPAFATLPLAILIAATHMIYGHQQPGDGFTAGVIIALAVALWYVVFGYEETRRRLPWLRGFRLIGIGVIIVFIVGTITYAMTGFFFAHINFGKMIGLPLPYGFDFSSAFLFEVAICLTVLGSAALIINTLGHPDDTDDDPADSRARG
jgi:multicomponent K+:H+ antiporter subunit A